MTPALPWSEWNARAAQSDACDPLAPMRDRFVLHDPDIVYLDGNSLGRLPRAVAERMTHVVAEQWGRRLIAGWNEGWWDLPRRVGDRIATLIGARAGEVLLCDSTSVNLFKLLVALLEATDPSRGIAIEASCFPSDGYIAQGLARVMGRPVPLHWIEGDLSTDEDVPAPLLAAFLMRPAVAVLSHVSFREGTRLDLAAVNAAARAHGVRVLWDFSHSVGAVPIDCSAEGVEAAVGCCYKYLNGGPGAPAFLYVARELQRDLRSPIQGWFGNHEPFAMRRDYEPAEGIARFLAGTTPVLSASAVEPAIELMLEAGVDRLWAKAQSQLVLLGEMLDAIAPSSVWSRATPRVRHGSHLSYRHANAQAVCRALIAAGVVPDFRTPDLVRFGVAPIYTRHVDLVVAARRAHAILSGDSWRDYSVGGSDVVT